MIVVIDGYNVLKNCAPHDIVSLPQRKQFIAQLRLYASKKGLDIVLVFDGGPFGWPSQNTAGSVCVVYAGAQQTADDYIKHYVQGHATKDLLLISSDRELATFAARQGVPSLKAADFYLIMHQELEKKDVTPEIKNNRLHKTTREENPELDVLMAGGTKKMPFKPDDDHVPVEREGHGQAATKDERALLKKIRKL